MGPKDLDTIFLHHPPRSRLSPLSVTENPGHVSSSCSLVSPIHICGPPSPHTQHPEHVQGLHFPVKSYLPKLTPYLGSP